MYLFTRPNVQSETNNFIDSKWQKSMKISVQWSEFFCWTNCPVTTKMPLESLQNYHIHYFYWRRNPFTAYFQLNQANDRLKNECRMDWIQSKPYIIHNLKDTLTTKWKITHKQVADLPIKYTWNFAHLEIRTGLSENFRHTQLTETFLIFPHVTNIP